MHLRSIEHVPSPRPPRWHRWRFRVGMLAVSAVALSATGAVAQAPAAEPTPPQVFSSSSPYNVPIPRNPVIERDSSAMVSRLARSGGAVANLYAYGDPVFESTASSPLQTVTCTKPWGSCALEERPLRIPRDARPTDGTDGRMIVVDRAAGRACDFWQARRTGSSTWSTSWGSCTSLSGSGVGGGGATGASINALAGVVRTHEIRQGRIDHALSFASDNSCRGEYRWPAMKTDGGSGRADCLPAGARVQLDPSIDVDDIPGITPAEKAVARALQVYGAYHRDNGGSAMAIAFEAPIGEPDPYPAAGLTWDFYRMQHIPWHRLRVLESWDGR